MKSKALFRSLANTVLVSMVVMVVTTAIVIVGLPLLLDQHDFSLGDLLIAIDVAFGGMMLIDVGVDQAFQNGVTRRTMRRVGAALLLPLVVLGAAALLVMQAVVRLIGANPVSLVTPYVKGVFGGPVWAPVLVGLAMALFALLGVIGGLAMRGRGKRVTTWISVVAFTVAGLLIGTAMILGDTTIHAAVLTGPRLAIGLPAAGVAPRPWLAAAWLLALDALVGWLAWRGVAQVETGAK
ncbi:hypothetical protein [Lacticaseibacillus parakribbianus]|uniref:hypothetical protein n=1 Tax=Lacticaseibacillus parakribbianus TaxID=2970927 RepID=UPI0021CB7F45|nr:hypothetical protein [Lacticaseibacillus parakribbianus]